MSALQVGAIGQAAEKPAMRSGGLRLLLTCPECGAAGRVDLQNLNQRMRCPNCRCQFLMAHDGQLLALDDLPQVDYKCPRCGQSGTIPSVLAVRKAECLRCRLPLARGPDRKLHGTREAAELRRIDESTDRKATFGDRMIARLETYDGRGVNIKTVGWCLLPSALVAASILMISFLPDLSPEATVARLTRACLSGHRKKPLLSLEDDAVQRAEFDRWRIRRFASIVDSHRPQGDAVEIEVRPIMATPDAAVFRVTMQSPFFGMRSHTQCWVKRNGVFVFDAVATLEKEDRL